MPNHCYNRLTITTDDYGLLIQMRDAALMENEKLLEFLCPFTAETDYEYDYDWCVENWGTKWDIFDVEVMSLEDERPSGFTAILELKFSTAWRHLSRHYSMVQSDTALTFSLPITKKACCLQV